jgi:hypothetical protein
LRRSPEPTRDRDAADLTLVEFLVALAFLAVSITAVPRRRRAAALT